MPKKEDM